MKAIILPFPRVAPLEEERRPGFAHLPSRASGRGYICDSVNHRIDVVDGDERPLFSFGGYGPLRGQFNAPSDVAIVSLDPQDPLTPASAILAVADRGNNRVQFFELDGAPLTAFGGRAMERFRKAGPARSGWPFFRLASTPGIVAPSRLEWRAPFLDVTLAGGAVVTLNLPSAILPEFSEWLRTADQSQLRQALNHFLQEPYRDEVPGSCLQRIAERLKAASIDTLGRTA